MFDGDEMNIHLPQSYESAIELEEIASIPQNVITPRHARPLIGVFQDSVVGSYCLTKKGINFTVHEFMNLMMTNKNFDGIMPEIPAGEHGRYTGQQVISKLLPALNMEMGNGMYDSKKGSTGDNNANFVKIKQGVVESGVFDSSIWMKPGKGIIHTTYNDYGPQTTVDLLDSIQRVVENFLVLNGFSVGISDLVADKATRESIDTIIEGCKKEIENILLQVHSGLFENNTGKTNQEEFEDQCFRALNQATDKVGGSARDSLSSENRLIAMVNSGSKGSKTNIAQMIACLGQQSIENKRIQYGLTDRTLPHYKKYDDGAEARGFIESSFIRGLTPQEFFFHAEAGREGLIDTAVKSITGDTDIIIVINGRPVYTKIGNWIDSIIDTTSVEHIMKFKERNMELVNIQPGSIYIPTTDNQGNTSWGEITAITRHDPGDRLYKITTLSGKSVIVTESKSLLIWNEKQGEFEHTDTPKVVVGDFVPVSWNLPACDAGKSAYTTTHTPAMEIQKELPVDLLTESSDYIQRVIDTGDCDEFIFKTQKDLNIFGMLMNRIGKFGDCITKLNVNGDIEYKYEPTCNFRTVNDIVLDKITGIEIIDPVLYPRVYDLTVPSTINFGLANGLHVVDTAQTGYTQRKIIKAMEDLKAHHDGTVRDANNNIVQTYYGEDGIMATRLEDQQLPIGTLSQKEIREKYGMSSSEFDWSTILAEGVERDANEPKRIEEHVQELIADQELLVNVIYRGMAVEGHIIAPVNLARFIMNTSVRFGTSQANKTDLTAIIVLDYINRIISYTKSAHNRIFCMLLRYYLSPYNIIVVHRFTKEAFIVLCEMIINTHMKSWVQPGEQVGIVAAQSIGEPSTQLTLNSVDWNERIIISKDGGATIMTPAIGEFIDMHMKNNKDAVKVFENNQEYLELNENQDGNKWSALSCDEDGKMVWTALEAITRHPVVNDDGTDTIIEVHTSTGRSVRATKGNSFLTQQGDKIVSIKGSELKLGDCLPLMKYMPLSPKLASSSPLNVRNIDKYRAVKYNVAIKLALQLAQQGVFVRIVEENSNLYKLQVIDLSKSTEFPEFPVLNDVVMDKIISITEVKPTHGKVYDLTVEKTRNFVLANTINMKDTFHLSGVATKSNVNSGIPRLNELLQVTKNPKATSLTIYMRQEYRQSKEKARELVQDLELTLLRNITNKVSIYWDPKDDAPVVSYDQMLINFFKKFEKKSGGTIEDIGGGAGAGGGGAGAGAGGGDFTNMSKWILRLELNKETMFNKNITMSDVVYVIKNKFAGTNIVYSDFNSKSLIMRIRIASVKETGKSWGGKADDLEDEETEKQMSTFGELDDFTNLKKFQNKLLTTCVIRGIPGIKAVTFRNDKQRYEFDASEEKYKQVDQYILDTDGTNFVKVMNHPAVDPTRLYTTNIHDIYTVLGLEAVRAVLLNEMLPIFADVGINYRHLGLLCDVMTQTGRIMSVDRNGINKNDIGPLAKMSFEETTRIVLNAATFGELDPVSGVSANIMMGQAIRGGTAFSQVLLDEDALVQMMAETGDDVEEDEEEDADISHYLDVNEARDPCSMTSIVNPTLPLKKTYKDEIKEDDVEFIEKEED
jgi:DNA-directed RNA polymerase beta' subunit